MTDKTFEKQLEKFGTDYVGHERQPTKTRAKSDEYSEAMATVVKELMNTVQGRHWFWEKLAYCQTFGFVCDPEKTHLNARFQGMQDVGMLIYQEINAIAPDLILTMNQEAAQRNMVSTRRQAQDED